MAIAEIKKFREKYPQYKDIDDATLANKLADKYPDAYGNLPTKIQESSELDKIPARYRDSIAKNQGLSFGKSTLNNLIDSGKETYREGVVPVLSGINTAALGLPRSLLNKFAPQIDDAIFPEQETLLGKTARGTADLRGLLKGGAMTAGQKASDLIKGAGAVSKIARGATTAGVAGGLQTNPDQEPVGVGSRLSNTVGAATVGGAIAAAPIAVGALKSGASSVSDKMFPKASQTVQSVKGKLLGYWEQNVKQYGDKLDELIGGIKEGEIDSAKVIDSLESKMQGLGMIDANGVKLRTPANKVEKQISSAYEKFLKEYANGNKISSKTFAEEVKAIKASGGAYKAGKVSQDKRLAMDTSRDLASNLEDFSAGLKSLNAGYSRFRTIFDEADSTFGVFKPEFSNKGLSSVLNYNSPASEGTRKLFSVLEKELDFKFVDGVKRTASIRDMENVNLLGMNIGSLLRGGRGAIELATQPVRKPIVAGNSKLQELLNTK